MGEQEGHLPYFYYKSKCRGGKSEDDRLPSPGGDSGEQASEREQGSEQDGKGADVGPLLWLPATSRLSCPHVRSTFPEVGCVCMCACTRVHTFLDNSWFTGL